MKSNNFVKEVTVQFESKEKVSDSTWLSAVVFY